MTTSYPISTVPAAVAYIVNAAKQQIAQDADAPKILLTLADPGTVPDAADEIIAFGEIRRVVDPSSFVGSGGAGFLEEAYSVDCVVSAWTGSSGDADAALAVELQQMQRAWQLLGYVETAVRLDPSLGLLVQRCYPKEAQQPRLAWTDDGEVVGLVCEITFDLYVEVRI